jgi:2-polyprenyl-6-methoxyphenol hydroxylase-like FAD-dependent oxidoreductase
LTSFEQNKNYVVAEFEDGHSERSDLLVGADGPSSTVRQQLLPDVYPKYAGYVAWRGVVDENKVIFLLSSRNIPTVFGIEEYV